MIAWLEWQEGRGDRLVADVNQTAAVVVPGPEDLFRPTAAVTADGVPWLVFGRSGGAVGVWACRFVDGRWSDPEPVSDTDGPSFNQEVAAVRGRGPARVLAGPGGRPVRRLRPAVERPRVGSDGPGE